ncbi:MAG TPA: beta-ketoacyl-[acyl-carrier-protein] synthase family protein [Pyrinomonadaceae bacterium]
MHREIAVVDYDCLTPAGLSIEASWKNLVNNRSAIGKIDRYDPGAETLFGVSAIQYGGQLPASFDNLAGSAEVFKKWSEPSYHAVKTLTRMILKRLDFNIAQHNPQRIAFLGGTALTSQISRDVLTKTQKADSKYILNQCQNIPLSIAASEFGMQGPCFSVGSACASSGHAILLACQFIEAGIVDCAIVVGYEFPLMPFSVGGLDWVNALYRRDEPEDRAYDDSSVASRPFSKDRRGFVLSEGAGAVFLSDIAYVRDRDWPVKGIIRGGYMNSDADHLTRASMQNVSLCMESAIKDARCNKEDIDAINAHSTSTPIGDAVELKALHTVFGEQMKRTPVVANKSQLGHSLGASSILGLNLALEGMTRSTLLPTLNHIPDPSLPEAIIPTESMEYRHDITLLNSFGFGGTNVSLVVEGRPA